MPATRTLAPPPADNPEQVVALDIETTGLSIFNDHITAISLSTGSWTEVFDVRRHEGAEVAAWLEQYVWPYRVIVHNGQFDLTFIKQSYGLDYPPALFDTMIAETLLTAGLYDVDEEDGSIIGPMSRSLQAAALRRLDITLSKDHEIRTGFVFDVEWSEEMIAYAAADAATLVPLYRVQKRLIVEQELAAVARMEMACVPIFCEMQRRGVVVDTARLKPLIDEAAARAAVIEGDLQTLLTPHVYWERMRQQRGEDARLVEWRLRYDEEMAKWGFAWLGWQGDDKLDIAVGEWKRQWAGTTIPGSSSSITAAEIEAWADEKVPKGKDISAGHARYVRRMMQYWRVGNPRPPVKVIDIQALINIRSVPQKTVAISAYIAAHNTTHGTDFEAPDNLQRKTLVAASVEAPATIQAELLSPLIEFSRLDKLVSAFGPPLAALLQPEPDGVGMGLHGGWRQVGTATGRPTCSKPNLLQMPAEPRFRSAFRARPGCKFIVADFSQIELRILAEMSGDPELRRAFVEGLDLHTLTAIDVLGADPDKVEDTLRRVAKIINFGVVYGMAENALRQQLAGNRIFVSRAEARGYLAKWRQRYAKAADLLALWGRQAVQRGYAATALGRRRYFDIPSTGLRGFLTGKVEREGANHPIQGGNADITKLAMALLQPELVKLGGSIILQVYDELVSEVPEEHAEEAKLLVRASMLTAAKSVLKTIPCKVDCVVSPSWNEKEATSWTPQVVTTFV